MPTMRSSQPSQALLESLAVRFILTLPRSELESFERLLFSVEQACAYCHVETRPCRAPSTSQTSPMY